VHLVSQLVVRMLPVALRDEPLNRAPRKIGEASRASLLAHAHELAKFIFRHPEVN
jgi:hypothetical protein